MIRFLISAALLVFACKKGPSVDPIATDSTWMKLTYAPNQPGLATNPLRGFVPYEWEANSPAQQTGFPYSMEFFYIPLSAVMTGPDRFDWTGFEATLNRIKARGNHAVPRFYIDYPTKSAQNFPPGMPQFLIEAKVPMRAYTALDNTVSQAPDWNNETLLSALETFAQAYGQRYDGDPRLGFIQVGLYGFWGEWHTYPYQPDGPLGQDWRMTEPNRTRLLRAFRSAFTNTAVQVRDPLATNDASLKLTFGYHDDSFAYNTLALDWYFLPKLKQNGLTDVWKTQSIGGELRPEVQLSIWNQWPNSAADQSEDWTTSVRQTHCSWLMAYALFAKQFGMTAAQQANALKGEALLGYQLTVSEVSLPGASAKQAVPVGLRFQNKGVAPFPYNWPAEFSVAPASGSGPVTVLSEVDVSLKTMLPTTTDGHERTVSLPQSLPTGQYRLLMRVKNPLQGGKPFRFANAEQDQHLMGYLTLGTFRVQ